jgi:hypothetical protein
MNETHDDHPDMGWSKVGERRKKKLTVGLLVEYSVICSFAVSFCGICFV